jgi:hypothetical protein
MTIICLDALRFAIKRELTLDNILLFHVTIYMYIICICDLLAIKIFVIETGRNTAIQRTARINTYNIYFLSNFFEDKFYGQFSYHLLYTVMPLLLFSSHLM